MKSKANKLNQMYIIERLNCLTPPELHKEEYMRAAFYYLKTNIYGNYFDKVYYAY